MKHLILCAALLVAATGCAALTERPPILSDHDGDPSTPAIVVGHEPSVLDVVLSDAGEKAPEMIEDAASGNISGVALTGGTILVGGLLYYLRRRKRQRAS